MIRTILYPANGDAVDRLRAARRGGFRDASPIGNAFTLFFDGRDCGENSSPVNLNLGTIRISEVIDAEASTLVTDLEAQTLKLAFLHSDTS